MGQWVRGRAGVLSGMLICLCLAVPSGMLICLCLAVPAAASASSGTTRPIEVKSASLTQHGRQLLWQVQLKQPFSFGALKRSGLDICLLIEGSHHGSLQGRACTAAPAAHPDRPLFIYAAYSKGQYGKWRVVRAHITQPARDELAVHFLPGRVGLQYLPLRWQVSSAATAPGCTPQTPVQLHPRPGVCTVLYPARPQWTRLHTPQLVGCQPSGNSFVTSGPSSKHEIALTFDDGPWNDPPTADFLNVLERNHVPATFFEIGSQISQFDPTGALEKRMLADGDMIGDHTWTHPDMTKLSASAQRSQIEMTAAAIKHATGGFEPCLFRPPYGAENSSLVTLARSLGMLTINWDVDTVDWSTPGTATIVQRAVSGAHNGAIILQHFGGGPRGETLAALPTEISKLRREGYRFVTVTQLLGLRLIYK